MENKFKFAEVKNGRIVSINEHSVPLDVFVTFFEPTALFIDITGITFDGESPAIGDIVSSDGTIKHDKSVYSPAELKAYTVELMKLTRVKKELEPIEHKVAGVSYMFDADTEANARMSKARQLLEDSGMNKITWTTFDNDSVDLTIDDFKAINIAQAFRSTQLHDRYNQLKTFIYSLENEDVHILTEDFSWDYDIKG